MNAENVEKRHTPGPWEWETQTGFNVCESDLLVSANGTNVLDYDGDVMNYEDQHLIAAAPDLLEALEGLLEGRSIVEPPKMAVKAHKNWVLFQNARAAIKKALGDD